MEITAETPTETQLQGRMATMQLEPKVEGGEEREPELARGPGFEPEPEPEPLVDDGRLFECRICGEEAPRSELCVPCGCRGGSELAHQACVQTWITTRATANHGLQSNDRCEVCNSPWTAGLFEIPSQLTGPARTASQQMLQHQTRQRAMNMLFAAHFRVTHDMARPNDRNTLLALGPHIDGGWSSWCDSSTIFSQPRCMRQPPSHPAAREHTRPHPSTE